MAKALRTILLVIGTLIALFGFTGLFVVPPFGIAFMFVGALLMVPFIRNRGEYQPKTNKVPTIQKDISALPSTEKEERQSIIPVVESVTPDNKVQIKSENHHVAGTSYRQKELRSLVDSFGRENPFYSSTKKELIDEGMENEKIYKWDYIPQNVELIEEPDNPYDSNAIKVVLDGVYIGYIKRGSCAHVKKLMHSGKIVKIQAEVTGGKYKYLSCDYDEFGSEEYFLEENETDSYFVTVTIKTKAE